MEKYINIRFKGRLAGLDIIAVEGSNKLTINTLNLREGLLTDHVKTKRNVSMLCAIKANL